MSENQQVTVPGNGHAVAEAPGDFLTRMASNQAMDADKLRVVAQVYIELQEKQRAWAKEDDAERARVAFFAAKPEMQAELPVVDKDTPNQEGKGKFTDFGDLWEACYPIWTKHGFTVSFDIVPTGTDMIRLKLLLDHKQGHREEYLAPDTPPDTTGPRGTVNKTIPQGSQSTITYVQRGLLCRALGIAMKREDNDGNSGARDDGYRPHTQSTKMREEVKRGPAEPPPQRPRQGQQSAQNGATSAWVEKVLASLDQAIRQDFWRWKQLVETACERATSLDDLNALDVALRRDIDDERTPPDSRVEINVAIGRARKRLTTPRFQHRLFDSQGEDDGEFHVEPLVWAQGFMAYWEATNDALNRENLLTHNADAIEAARQYPGAAQLLAAATLPPDDGGPNGTPSPSRLSFYEAVRPPQDRGGPSWPAWLGLLRDELGTIPDLAADLLPWTEAQQPVLAEAAIAQRIPAVRMIATAFHEAGQETPPWLAGLVVPKDKLEADEAWFGERMADLDKLPKTSAGRKQFTGLIEAMKPEMRRLNVANHTVYTRIKAAYEAKHQELPA